ncbi:unnamed protein product [Prorocentrum cordatum]|uniref:Uncharacterized protein n=1 Tax=Prorocentrum cordatum TaxID=2364126 RepID=A0ABN9V1W4_9DINO|nr:unnamed protein product [Polarella glacialis]
MALEAGGVAACCGAGWPGEATSLALSSLRDCPTPQAGADSADLARGPEPTEPGSLEPSELRGPERPPGCAEGAWPSEGSLAPTTPRSCSPEPGDPGPGPTEVGSLARPGGAEGDPAEPASLAPAALRSSLGRPAGEGSAGRVAALRLVYGQGPSRG